MDWDPLKRPFTNHEFSQFDHYVEQETIAISKLETDQFVSIQRIWGSKAWEKWFDTTLGLTDGTTIPGILVMLCSRAPEIFPGQPAPVSHLPFEHAVWWKLVKVLHVHRSITRTISRQVARFSAVRYTCPETGLFTLSYTLRMSAALPDDLALSLTFLPESGKTYGVVYGCNAQQMRAIETRIRAAEDTIEHHLLLPGIFVELERERLLGLVEDLVDRFTLGSDIFKNSRWDQDGKKMQDYLSICLQCRNLVRHMNAVKRQLRAFIDELDTLQREWELKPPACYEDTDKRQRVLGTGQRIKQRLKDIMDEYDDKIDQCENMTQDLSLAMQTGWNQTAREDSATNTKMAKVNAFIAFETKRESSQMRSIALLGMIYLPVSCVASIFSTSLFDFSPGSGDSIISPYIWILIVISAVLTAITVLIWHFATNRDHRKDTKRTGSFGINFDDHMV